MLAFLMLTFLFYIISKEDLNTKQIPDEADLAICILAVGRGGFGLDYVCLALAAVILTGLVMGIGDAKLFGALSLLLGSAVLTVAAASFILAGIYCLASLICGDLRVKDTVAFAPFIAVPALAVFYAQLFTDILPFTIAVKNMI